jgi:high-affinity iron transporter
MLPSFVLSLREGLEAALIIGIVLGALSKMNRKELAPAVWQGFASAVVASILAAIVMNFIGAEFEGRSEQIFEGVAMFLAAGILTWMIFWMRRTSRGLKTELEASVRKAAFDSGRKAIFALAFLAVGREGFELALFLFATKLEAGAIQVISGALLGLAGAALLGWLLFTSTRRLSLNRFFQITNVLLILFAAGLVAHGIHEFNEAHLVPEVVEHIWDINPILNEDSTVGELLSALLGYNGNPSLTEVIAYLGYFGVLALGLKVGSKQSLEAPRTA